MRRFGFRRRAESEDGAGTASSGSGSSTHTPSSGRRKLLGLSLPRSFSSLKPGSNNGNNGNKTSLSSAGTTNSLGGTMPKPLPSCPPGSSGGGHFGVGGGSLASLSKTQLIEHIETVLRSGPEVTSTTLLTPSVTPSSSVSPGEATVKSPDSRPSAAHLGPRSVSAAPACVPERLRADTPDDYCVSPCSTPVGSGTGGPSTASYLEVLRQNEALKSLLAQVSADKKVAEATASELRGELLRIQCASPVSDVVDPVSDLQNELAGLKVQNANLTWEMESKAADANRRHAEEVKQLKTDLSATRDQFSEVQTELENLQAKTSNFQSTINTLRLENNVLRVENYRHRMGLAPTTQSTSRPLSVTAADLKRRGSLMGTDVSASAVAAVATAASGGVRMNPPQSLPPPPPLPPAVALHKRSSSFSRDLSLTLNEWDCWWRYCKDETPPDHVLDLTRSIASTPSPVQANFQSAMSAGSVSAHEEHKKGETSGDDPDDDAGERTVVATERTKAEDGDGDGDGEEEVKDHDTATNKEKEVVKGHSLGSPPLQRRLHRHTASDPALGDKIRRFSGDVQAPGSPVLETAVPTHLRDAMTPGGRHWKPRPGVLPESMTVAGTVALISSVLSRVPMFQSLTETEKAVLAASLEPHRYSDSDVIHDGTDKSTGAVEAFYIVVSGTVAVVDASQRLVQPLTAPSSAPEDPMSPPTLSSDPGRSSLAGESAAPSVTASTSATRGLLPPRPPKVVRLTPGDYFIGDSSSGSRCLAVGDAACMVLESEVLSKLLRWFADARHIREMRASPHDGRPPLPSSQAPAAPSSSSPSSSSFASIPTAHMDASFSTSSLSTFARSPSKTLNRIKSPGLAMRQLYEACQAAMSACTSKPAYMSTLRQFRNAFQRVRLPGRRDVIGAHDVEQAKKDIVRETAIMLNGTVYPLGDPHRLAAFIVALADVVGVEILGQLPRTTPYEHLLKEWNCRLEPKSVEFGGPDEVDVDEGEEEEEEEDDIVVVATVPGGLPPMTGRPLIASPKSPKNHFRDPQLRSLSALSGGRPISRASTLPPFSSGIGSDGDSSGSDTTLDGDDLNRTTDTLDYSVESPLRSPSYFETSSGGDDRSMLSPEDGASAADADTSDVTPERVMHRRRRRRLNRRKAPSLHQVALWGSRRHSAPPAPHGSLPLLTPDSASLGTPTSSSVVEVRLGDTDPDTGYSSADVELEEGEDELEDGEGEAVEHEEEEEVEVRTDRVGGMGSEYGETAAPESEPESAPVTSVESLTHETLCSLVSSIVADVLVASCRSVTGGDSYAECTRLFGCGTLVMILNETGPTSPTEVVIHHGRVLVQSVNTYRVMHMSAESGGEPENWALLRSVVREEVALWSAERLMATATVKSTGVTPDDDVIQGVVLGSSIQQPPSLSSASGSSNCRARRRRSTAMGGRCGSWTFTDSEESDDDVESVAGSLTGSIRKIDQEEGWEWLAPQPAAGTTPKAVAQADAAAPPAEQPGTAATSGVTSPVGTAATAAAVAATRPHALLKDIVKRRARLLSIACHSLD